MSRKLSGRKLIAQMSVPPVVASLGGSVFSSIGSAQTTDDKLSGARVFNVREFGAKGDGKNLDTVAVQSAIDAAHKDQGGTVLIPAGTFVVDTIELKSNVPLQTCRLELELCRLDLYAQH